MFAIVGLGNPGARYEQTRHNVGFRAVGALGDMLGGAGDRKSWENKFGCSFLRLREAGESYILILPQKFMNLSGEAAVPLLKYFKIETERLVVVYDELDLPPGEIRLRKGGSAAGHGGLSDILRHLGEDGFFRVRIGIGHPRRKNPENSESSSLQGKGRQDVSAWVLGQPGPEDKELIDKAVPRAAQAVMALLKNGLASAQQEFHGKASN